MEMQFQWYRFQKILRLEFQELSFSYDHLPHFMNGIQCIKYTLIRFIKIRHLMVTIKSLASIKSTVFH